MYVRQFEIFRPLAYVSVVFGVAKLGQATCIDTVFMKTRVPNRFGLSPRLFSKAIHMIGRVVEIVFLANDVEVLLICH